MLLNFNKGIILSAENYRMEIENLLVQQFLPLGFKITRDVEVDTVAENSKYEALNFSLNDRRIVYRKGNVTPDRPGAFLSVWQRPVLEIDNGNKPIPLHSDELDYLFIQVEDESERGLFIFPVEVLKEKGIVFSATKKGKTGFRVFPPWSQDRGEVGTKVFSESGKKTQRWQLPFFIEIAEDGSIDAGELTKVFSA